MRRSECGKLPPSLWRVLTIVVVEACVGRLCIYTCIACSAATSQAIRTSERLPPTRQRMQYYPSHNSSKMQSRMLALAVELNIAVEAQSTTRSNLRFAQRGVDHCTISRQLDRRCALCRVSIDRAARRALFHLLDILTKRVTPSLRFLSEETGSDACQPVFWKHWCSPVVGVEQSGQAKLHATRMHD